MPVIETKGCTQESVQGFNLLFVTGKILHRGQQNLQQDFNLLCLLQVKYYTEANKTYSRVSAKLQEDCGITGISSDDFDQRMQQKLGEIRALSITVDD